MAIEKKTMEIAHNQRFAAAKEMLAKWQSVYMKLSYKETLAHYEAQRLAEDQFARFEDTPEGDVFVSICIGKLGRWRKRLSVEITAQAEGWEKWPHVPCAYFEKYPNGINRTSTAIATAKLTVFASLLILAFIAMVWLRWLSAD